MLCHRSVRSVPLAVGARSTSMSPPCIPPCSVMSLPCRLPSGGARRRGLVRGISSYYGRDREMPMKGSRNPLPRLNEADAAVFIARMGGSFVVASCTLAMRYQRRTRNPPRSDIDVPLRSPVKSPLRPPYVVRVSRRRCGCAKLAIWFRGRHEPLQVVGL